MRTKLTTAELISTVEGCRSVPVNALLANAIEAHQTIGRRYQGANDPHGQEVARFALQVILFASTPSADDLRRQLEYLLALPLEAWAWPGQNGEETRETWLRGITRCLVWITSEARGKSRRGLAR